MKLSVIVVAYNEVEYIDMALNSIIEQKGIFDYEIIIGDDGSNDGTLDKIMCWQRRYPNFIQYFVMDRPETNKDVIASIRASNIIKKAIHVAQGDYISFLAGDDYYIDNFFFSEHIKMLESYKNRDCSGCMCDYQKYWNDKHIEIIHCPHNNESKLKASVFWGGHMYVHLSTFVFRNVFKSTNFYPDDMNFIDDIGMEFLMGQYGDFCYLPIVMFCYRQREGSIMDKNDPNDNLLCSMLLYTDIRRNHLNKHRISSYSRIAGSVKKLLKERQTLVADKYEKYFNISQFNSYSFNRLVLRGNAKLIDIFICWLKVVFLYFCYAPYRLIYLLKYKK